MAARPWFHCTRALGLAAILARCGASAVAPDASTGDGTAASDVGPRLDAARDAREGRGPDGDGPAADAQDLDTVATVPLDEAAGPDADALRVDAFAVDAGGAPSDVASPDAACPPDAAAAYTPACPALGSPCALGQPGCTVGDDPRSLCRTDMACIGGVWTSGPPRCATPVVCPTREPSPGASCDAVGAECAYPGGSYTCTPARGCCALPASWVRLALPCGCPPTVPNLGAPCPYDPSDPPLPLECDYGWCAAGAWGLACGPAGWLQISYLCPG